MTCVYAQLCNCYQIDSVTCNKEPGPYCGKFREFEEKYNKKNS